ncbi:TPA: glycosyltransferase [Vibrio vulnificus]|nr:glycosyltransferase [Vibrio vulnificus]
MSIRVSVIIPAYNSQDTIECTVNSVLEQNYSNFELIVVNDGSHDNTQEKLKRYGEKIKLISIENRGVAAARSIGLSSATGEYVMFLDSDDRLNTNALSSLVNECESNDYDIVIGQSKIIHANGHTSRTKFSRNEDVSCLENYLDNNFPVTFWPAIYKKSILLNVKLNNGFITGEDFVVNSEIYSNEPSVSVIDNLVHTYSRSPGSITANMNPIKYQDNFKAFKKGVDIIITVRGSEERIESAIYKKYLNYCFSILLARSPYFYEALESMRNYKNENSLPINSWSYGLRLNILSFIFNKDKCILKLFVDFFSFLRNKRVLRRDEN